MPSALPGCKAEMIFIQDVRQAVRATAELQATACDNGNSTTLKDLQKDFRSSSWISFLRKINLPISIAHVVSKDIGMDARRGRQESYPNGHKCWATLCCCCQHLSDTCCRSDTMRLAGCRWLYSYTVLVVIIVQCDVRSLSRRITCF